MATRQLELDRTRGWVAIDTVDADVQKCDVSDATSYLRANGQTMGACTGHILDQYIFGGNVASPGGRLLARLNSNTVITVVNIAVLEHHV